MPKKIIIEADGGSRGNPGIAGAGTVIFNADHTEVLAEVVEALGKATNNVAEYRGVINGLQVAADSGAEEVDVYMDSKLVVEQLSGRWKIKHPDMAELAATAKNLMSAIGTVTLTWVPRAKNKHADRLSNVAMDHLAEGGNPGYVQGKGLVVLGQEPPGQEQPGQEQPGQESVPPEAEPSRSAGHWSGDGASQPIRLLLLRHGETRYSTELRYSGWGDPELTTKGKKQAERAAGRILDLVGGEATVASGDLVLMSSPLVRTRETADIVAGTLGISVKEIGVHEGLKELNFGAFDGLTFTEARQSYPEEHEAWVTDAVSHRPPGGETVRELYQRVRSWRRKVLGDTPAGTTIVIVTHVTVIKCLIAQALGAGPGVVNSFFLDPAGVSEIEVYPESGKNVIRRINETGHIADLAT